MTDSAPCHVPVMPAEVLQWLDPQSGATVVDGTFGGGGHARLIATRVGPQGQVIGIDRDPVAVAAAQEHLPANARIVCASYAELPSLLAAWKLRTVDGVLLDLGLSSDQLADRERGFSFRTGGPLDLRFNPDEGEPAWRLIARLSERDLANLIYRYGEERKSRRIARRIVEQRRRGPIKSSSELAEVVRGCFPRPPRSAGRRRIDPATRTFQALRIAVNDELRHLERALQVLPDCLAIGGRFVAISFHSLEDRMVKRAFLDDDRWRPLTRKPVIASEAELADNSRARSAKLRAACRVEVDDIGRSA